jgi:hypothetical protein
MQTSNRIPSSNAFEHFCIPNSSHSNRNYNVLISFHLGLHIEMDPTPHAIMPRSSRMALPTSFTGAGFGTSCVSRKATHNLSHSKFACLLTLVIVFYLLRWSQVKGLFIHGRVMFQTLLPNK